MIHQTAAVFKSQEFEKLIVEGIRAEHSTSAKPGSGWRHIVNLTK